MNDFNQQLKQQKAIRFNKWMNKGYAAFVSVGKVVNIGRLALSICQWIGQVVEFVEEILCICQEKKEDKESSEEQEEIELLPVMVSKDFIYPELYKIVNYLSR